MAKPPPPPGTTQGLGSARVIERIQTKAPGRIDYEDELRDVAAHRLEMILEFFGRISPEEWKRDTRQIAAAIAAAFPHIPKDPRKPERPRSPEQTYREVLDVRGSWKAGVS